MVLWLCGLERLCELFGEEDGYQQLLLVTAEQKESVCMMYDQYDVFSNRVRTLK